MKFPAMIDRIMITPQLLAAYAENKVTVEEKAAVRRYLSQHPKELESVLYMMDTYDSTPLDVEDDYENSHKETTHGVSAIFPQISMCAAAFAPPQIVPLRAYCDKQDVARSYKDKASFVSRLDSLLDD